MQIQMMHMHISMPTPMQPIPKTLVADARAAVDACAGWNARLAARRITSFLNRRMQGSGLSLAQFGLMAQIASARDDTLGALAQRTGLDQSTLSRNLQVLEASGLIEIAAGDKDARRRAVWLTEKGALSLEAGLADWRRAHGELAERLDPEAARRLAVAAEALEEGEANVSPESGFMPPPGGSCACRAGLAGSAIAGETEASEAEQHHGPG